MFFNDHFCTVFHFFVNVMLLQQTFYPSGIVLDTYSTHFHSFPSFSDDFTFNCPSTDKHMTHSVPKQLKNKTIEQLLIHNCHL